MSAAYLLERAVLDDGAHDRVLVVVAEGRFAAVTPLAAGASGPAPISQAPVIQVPGLTLPGLANTHSHAFHRALRGRTQAERGTFWTWRERMYDLAARLDPDSYYRLARATYREMAAAGITGVGEFHYLHHRPDGAAYAEANAMGAALIAAARDVGLRITLLDTLYLESGVGRPVHGVQRRYCDGSVSAWWDRVAALPRADGVVIGRAVHSVRAVPAQALTEVGTRLRETPHSPLHVHLSEQRAENRECQTAYRRSPTRLLHDCGLLGPATTAVHATHLSAEDVRLLGESRTRVALCPTTERDLGDGIGPGGRLHRAGCPLSVGSDSHAVIDPFEELRAIELHERLATGERGHWRAADLLRIGSVQGHAGLGVSDAGRIAVGHRADLVTLDLASPRTAGAGADEQTAVFAATAADVRQVMVDGRILSIDPEETGRELAAAIAAIEGTR